MSNSWPGEGSPNAGLRAGETDVRKFEGGRLYGQSRELCMEDPLRAEERGVRRRIGPLLFASILLCTVLQRFAGGEIAPLSQDQLQAESSDIVVGVVTKRTITADTSDPNWDKRSFFYEIEVEAVEKGDFQRGNALSATASARKWIGSGIPPPSGAGHQPLPLEGERARFFLKPTPDEALAIVLPNGVELATQADPSNPVRFGDPAPPDPAIEIEAETGEKPSGDPFGWEIILVLLAVPLVIGGLRQQSASRWGLLVVACVLFCGAAIIALW